jgi:hypothetical protein
VKESTPYQDKYYVKIRAIDEYLFEKGEFLFVKKT